MSTVPPPPRANEALANTARYFAARLEPGEDLRAALLARTAHHGFRAAAVLSMVGSLAEARLRFAGRDEAAILAGPLEIVSAEGTLGDGALHIHLALARADGTLCGGHLLPGCRVATTAEIALAVFDELVFERHHDAATGYRELTPRLRHSEDE